MNLPRPKHAIGSAAASCRRRADRRAYKSPVSLSVMRGSEFCRPVDVTAVDISVCGIGVLTRQMMHRGAVGALHLRMPDGSTAIVGVVVMNCHYVGEMNHRVGLQFTELHPSYAESPHMPENSRVIQSRNAHQAFRDSFGTA